jgi:hypothetical protein
MKLRHAELVTSANPRLPGKSAGVIGVVSSDLLGCCFGMLSIRDGWDHYLLLLVNMFGMWVCGRILWEEYGSHFHRKKSDGKKQQKHGQPDNTTGGNLCKLRRQIQNLRVLLKNYRRSESRCAKVVNIILNLAVKCGYLGLNLFGRHKSKKRKQPNEKS